MKKSYFMAMSLIAGLGWLNATDQSTVKKEEVSTLGTVVVTDKKDSSLTVPSAETTAQQLNKVAGGTNLILGEDLKKGRVNTWRDVFQSSPGVFVQPRFGAEEARISIRGSGIQRTFHGRGITVLQDGIPVNLTDGAFDMQGIEPLASDYVSVWRGANALRYGSSTLGGAIDFTSKTGYTADLFQARAEYGSFGTMRGQVSSGEVVGPADYYVSLTHWNQDGFRDHADQSTQKVIGNLGWRLNNEWENRFFIAAANSRSELPGSLTKNQLYQDPTQANGRTNSLTGSNLGLNQQRNYEALRLSDKISWRDRTSQQSFDGSVYWAWKDLDHPIFQVIDQETNDVGLHLVYENSTELFGRKNRFTVGTNQGYGVANAAQFDNNAGNRGTKRLDQTQTATNHDLFVENEHYFTDRFALVLGSQFLLATREIESHPELNFAAAQTRSFSEAYTSWNPKVGFLYDFTKEIVGYLNYSHSSEPPSFSELGSTATGGVKPIDQQVANTIEIGNRGKAGRFEWDATYYYAWIQDEYLTVNNAQGASLGTDSATATHHQGIELGLTTKLWEGLWETGATEKGVKDSLSIRQTYLWQQFQFDSDPVYGNSSLPGMPEHVYRAELTYEHPCGFYIGPSVDWVPVKAPVDEANTLYAEEYALLNARVGYKTKKGFSIFFEAKNLLDTTYAASTGVIADARPGSVGSNTSQFLPGDGQSFYGGVEFKY